MLKVSNVIDPGPSSLIAPSGGRLVLRHRRPIHFPYPNAFSHPLPQFSYSASTGHIKVIYEVDPAFPPTASSPSTAWKEKEHLVTSIPERKPPSMFESASRLVTTAISPLAATFAAAAGPSTAESEGTFDLREEEIMEEERAENEEDDDAPHIGRAVKVITLPKGWMEKDRLNVNPKARERRRWEVVPLIPHKVKTLTG